MYEADEWYACGYGKIRSTGFHQYTKDGMHYKVNVELALVSAVQPAYYESRVRYILADMQLGGIVEAYRAEASDADMS